MKCHALDPMKCYNSMLITKSLNSNDIQTYLGVRGRRWSVCSERTASGFSDYKEFYAGNTHNVAELLDKSDIRVLAYAGDAELTHKWYGVYAWTRELEWTHKDEFNAGKPRVFLTKRAHKAGMIRSYGSKFTFVLMYNAGRMMPMDQPVASLEMIQKFIANEPI